MKHFLMLEIDAEDPELDYKLIELAKGVRDHVQGQGPWIKAVTTQQLNTTRDHILDELNKPFDHDRLQRFLGSLASTFKLEPRDEEGRWQPEEKPPAEFREKQRELALAMFSIAYNRGFNSLEAIAEDPDYGQSYVDNYMADADEVLRSQPHLLGLETREKMGLDK